MTEKQRKIIMGLADTLKGEINRMCVTDELTELDTMWLHAKKNLDILLDIIYDARFKEESEGKNESILLHRQEVQR